MSAGAATWGWWMQIGTFVLSSRRRAQAIAVHVRMKLGAHGLLN